MTVVVVVKGGTTETAAGEAGGHCDEDVDLGIN